MQKLLESKFKEGQYVVTPEGTGKVYRVDPSSIDPDSTIVLVALDGQEVPVPFYSDQVWSCDE